MPDNTESKSDWQEREIGALWKQSGRNQNYLSGHVNDEKVVIFMNKGKSENPKAPVRPPGRQIHVSEPSLVTPGNYKDAI